MRARRPKELRRELRSLVEDVWRIDRRRSVQSHPTAQDAAALLAAIVANQPTAMEGAPFTPGAADAQRAGLEYHNNRVRFDAAMRWLIDNEMLERDKEAEGLLIHVKGLPDYDYGRAFRITEHGRALLPQAGEAGA